jgi:hypothetical protein
MNLDLIFSHWIFVWYLLYYFKIVKINPKIAIICGIVINVIMLLLMFICHTNIKLILFFSLIVLLTKIIPLITIWNKKINPKEDIPPLMTLFVIYLVWAFINLKKVCEFIEKIKILIFYNKNIISTHYIDNLLDIT